MNFYFHTPNYMTCVDHPHFIGRATKKAYTHKRVYVQFYKCFIASPSPRHHSKCRGEISERRKKNTPDSNTSLSAQEQKKPFHIPTPYGLQSPGSFQLCPGLPCNYFRQLDLETWLELQKNNVDSLLLNVLLIDGCSERINPQRTRATAIFYPCCLEPMVRAAELLTGRHRSDCRRTTAVSATAAFTSFGYLK